MTCLEREQWLNEARWNLKVLKRHISKMAGRIAHSHSREKDELTAHANTILSFAKELEGKISAEAKEEHFSALFSFLKKAKKEVSALQKETERLSARLHAERLSHLLERCIWGVQKMEEMIAEMEKMGEGEFAQETHRVAKIMEIEKQNVQRLHGMIGRIRCPEAAHALFEVEKARLMLNELERGAREMQERAARERKRERLETMKSHIVNAMVAAHSGKLHIDKNGILVKSDFNTREQSFFLGELMQEALSDFFEGNVREALGEIARGKHHTLVGNFQTEFSEGEPSRLILSIGKRHAGSEALVYRPTQMHMEKRHLEEAARRQKENFSKPGNNL